MVEKRGVTGVGEENCIRFGIQIPNKREETSRKEKEVRE
jgi:hypothetical protein